ncbi:hypothetical protein MKZ38_001896 [Zalerion maritima]|uniref:Uncharacterized protein n=1 Tax=Zalerion maritima TaxID=339359 RepID=A0AAD5WSU7_9PEZI|nr:hypothetical protein MKZ38_001896 [Zalerion maritima]
MGDLADLAFLEQHAAKTQLYDDGKWCVGFSPNKLPRLRKLRFADRGLHLQAFLMNELDNAVSTDLKVACCLDPYVDDVRGASSTIPLCSLSGWERYERGFMKPSGEDIPDECP